jgi:ABC-type microcin C transport system duplicated ATPase subunit YejF
MGMICQVAESEMEQIRGKDIAMVFQDPMTALTSPVHRSPAGEPLRHLRMDKEAIRKRSIRLLEQVGIQSAHRLTEFRTNYPGGQRQRHDCHVSRLSSHHPDRR